MGNTCWGLGIHLVFMICVFSVTFSQNWVGSGNLTSPSCSEQVRLALLKFKHSVKYYQGMLSSWGVGNDCCKWDRVECDDVTGRVVSLHLRNLRRDDYTDNYLFVEYYEEYLDGDELNSCLTELVNLKHLDLSGNNFQQSRIPKFIGSLKQLRYLNLSRAVFRGDQLQTLTDSSAYADNTYLCGAPLPKECSPHENLPTKTTYESVNEPKKVLFYLDIMIGFATGFWGIILVLLFKKQWRHKLFMFCEETKDKMYVAVAVRVLRIKRGRGAT